MYREKLVLISSHKESRTECFYIVHCRTEREDLTFKTLLLVNLIETKFGSVRLHL